eukprot:TRINITY_DN4942_c0_g2_i6.p1 TRINITY_DN4942_c0_g2~~TRINITY_DN4942_c0_g2_i6.p1  ORF type:complete len:102 (+),score=6.29 TRINITY_DN4942_c0_g2_i6:113-418(+)
MWRFRGSKEPPTLTPESAKMIMSVTGFSVDQVQAMFDEFVAMHPSGQINKKRLRHMFHQSLPKMEKITDHLFRLLDSNGDGKIDFSGCLSYITSKMEYSYS